VWLKFLNQGRQQGMNFAKALGKMVRAFARGAQGAEAQQAAAAAVAFYHAVTGRAGGGGIDAEDAIAIIMGSRRQRHGNECTARREVRLQFFPGVCSDCPNLGQRMNSLWPSAFLGVLCVEVFQGLTQRTPRKAENAEGASLV
jgi:hypothetical protein